MIRFEHVHLDYPSGHKALNDIDLTIHLGEFVVLYGPSGCGKSSLLKLLHRQRVPSQGDLFIVDQNLASLERSALPILRRGVSFLPSTPKLLSNLTILDNVALPIKLAGEPQNVAQRRAMETLRDLKLDEHAQTHPATLPPATLQLCCLARCLVTAPSILLCDDPTANLDPTVSKQLLRSLRDAHLRGMTILLATTDPSAMDSNYQRILVMREGTVASDTPATRFRSLHLPTHADAQISIQVELPSETERDELASPPSQDAVSSGNTKSGPSETKGPHKKDKKSKKKKRPTPAKSTSDPSSADNSPAQDDDSVKSADTDESASDLETSSPKKSTQTNIKKASKSPKKVDWKRLKAKKKEHDNAKKGDPATSTSSKEDLLQPAPPPTHTTEPSKDSTSTESSEDSTEAAAVLDPPKDSEPTAEEKHSSKTRPKKKRRRPSKPSAKTSSDPAP